MECSIWILCLAVSAKDVVDSFISVLLYVMVLLYLYHKKENLSRVFGNINNEFVNGTEVENHFLLALFTIQVFAFLHFYYLYGKKCVKI
jgi:hypothetical protein